jgi:L-iditol 2-dehydrogenase
LTLARDLGADHIINVSEKNVEKEVKTITKQKGVDIALECSGNQKGADDCLSLLRRQGKYTQIGIFGKPIALDLDRVLYGEIQLTGSFSQKYTGWKAALELASLGKIQARPLITDILPLEEWEKGFKRSFEGKAIKVVFQPEM